ncbi:unnamed protein product [marine sediment metagenome]|uniref:Uncharacterized protein n=1 Tax=marine sediment metagenome TaxID=412755 RepID=X1Q0Z2_9ZZZZ
MVMNCDAPPLPGQQARGSPRFNYRSARVTCCARSNAAVTVRVYDPDTPSFVLEQQDAGLDQALVVLGAAHLVPHGANVAVVGP